MLKTSKHSAVWLCFTLKCEYHKLFTLPYPKALFTHKWNEDFLIVANTSTLPTYHPSLPKKIYECLSALVTMVGEIY